MSQVKKKRLDAWDLEILNKIAEGLNWIYAIDQNLTGITLGTIQGKLSRLERLGLIERNMETLRYALSHWGVFCLNHHKEFLQFIRKHVRKLDPIPYEKISKKFGLTEEDAKRFAELFEGLRFGEVIPGAGDHSIESKRIYVKEFIYGCEEAKKPQVLDLGVLGKRLVCVECDNGILISKTESLRPVCNECGQEYVGELQTTKGSLIPTIIPIGAGLVAGLALIMISQHI